MRRGSPRHARPSPHSRTALAGQGPTGLARRTTSSRGLAGHWRPSYIRPTAAPPTLPTNLSDQLQATLGSAYTLERELGGGGMSRVFVAQEQSLNRKVVVKVLPPDLAAGVSVDRFKREIQVAAGLHHPHIVPVLAAGETEGLPFYTMPFVESEGLRARLGRGALPIPEAEARAGPQALSRTEGGSPK